MPPRFAGAANLCPQPRPLAEPGPRLLKLRGELQQRRLVAEASGEMDADRKPFFRPMQGYRGRRLSRDVEDRGERRIVDDAFRPEPIVEKNRVAHGETADARRRLRQRGGDQNVVALEELRDLPTGGVDDVNRLQIVRPVDAVAVFERAPRRRLDLVSTWFAPERL